MIGFKLKRPCKNCPFRKDCLPGWLGKERAQGIADAVVLGDGPFPCHETVNYNAWSDESEYTYQGREQFCAGAIALEEKENQGGNLLIRLGRMTGAFNYSQLLDKELVFDSVRQFVKHHNSEKK